jgi:hypothetical protein
VSDNMDLVATPASAVAALAWPARALATFHRVWPLAGLAFAAVVNAGWIGLLGYEFFQLIKPAFF